MVHRYPVVMAAHQNRSQALTEQKEGIERVVRRQIQACPGMFRLRSSINASLSPLTPSQSETSTVLQCGAAPSGG